MGHLLLALAASQALANTQDSRPASAPGAPYERLQAELRLALPGPEGARDREKILRKWFVLRQPEHHQALQELLRSGPDEGNRSTVLGFLQADLPALLDGGGASTPAGKLFLGYLDPLIQLAGEGPKSLAGHALSILRELPCALARARLQAHLKPPGGPLLGAALAVAGSFRDTSLAPDLAAWLETPTHGSAARAALSRLTFRSFPSGGAFAAWWETAGSPTWEALRDGFLEQCLTGEENRVAGEEAAARLAREQARAQFSPLVRDLVELRVRSRDWAQPLALLRQGETRQPSLQGVVAAFQADRKLFEGLGPEQEKACRETFELLLDLASQTGPGLNGDLLQALSFLAYAPPERSSQAARALATLLERARTGTPEARATVLGYLAAFTGWQADRALLELFCEPETTPEVLFRLLDLLKGRSLSEAAASEEAGPVLERVLLRLPDLLADGELPRRVRSDALLFTARLPSGRALPFLERVLLGREGMGTRLEDRLAAADALQDLLLRQRKVPGLVEKVGGVLQAGLRLRDTQGASLARVRASCAEKLGSDPFADPAFSSPLMEGLGLALVIETAPEALEAIVTAMRKLGQKALKEPAAKGLQKARFLLLQRLENPSGTARVQGEGDILFPAVVELCSPDPAARRQAARAFAAMGHREHALSLFESLTSAPGGAPAEGAQPPADLAALLREHLSTLLTGKLPREGSALTEPLLPDLGEAELGLAAALLTKLGALREAGALPDWGRREQEWRLAVAWGLAMHRQASGHSGAELFSEAADILKEILTTQSLPPLEKLSFRMRLAEALLVAAPVRPQALAEAQTLLQALVQEEPAVAPARRFLARVLERQGSWAAAAVEWQALADLSTGAGLEEWEALLQSLACLIRSDQAVPAAGLYRRLQERPLPPEGPDRDRIEKELARLGALLTKDGGG